MTRGHALGTSPCRRARPENPEVHRPTWKTEVVPFSFRSIPCCAHFFSRNSLADLALHIRGPAFLLLGALIRRVLALESKRSTDGQLWGQSPQSHKMIEL